MSKLKIYVSCHKPCDVLQDEVYTPIHVGRTLSKYKEEMAGLVGDNISEKNPFYSEMTAQYWAWKNVHDCEYIGFCHYRRTFQTHFSNNCIEDFFRWNGYNSCGSNIKIRRSLQFLKNIC